MARITVEDCIERVPNRFELVMVASQRARKIGSGAPLTIERDNDKKTVISLREIAERTVEIEDLKEELIRSHQRVVAYEDDDAEIDLMDGEKEWSTMAGEQSGEEGSVAGNEDQAGETLEGAAEGDDQSVSVEQALYEDAPEAEDTAEDSSNI